MKTKRRSKEVTTVHGVQLALARAEGRRDNFDLFVVHNTKLPLEGQPEGVIPIELSPQNIQDLIRLLESANS